MKPAEPYQFPTMSSNMYSNSLTNAAFPTMGKDVHELMNAEERSIAMSKEGGLACESAGA